MIQQSRQTKTFHIMFMSFFSDYSNVNYVNWIGMLFKFVKRLMTKYCHTLRRNEGGEMKILCVPVQVVLHLVYWGLYVRNGNGVIGLAVVPSFLLFLNFKLNQSLLLVLLTCEVEEKWRAAVSGSPPPYHHYEAVKKFLIRCVLDCLVASSTVALCFLFHLVRLHHKFLKSCLSEFSEPVIHISFLSFIPEDGRRSSFRNVVILLKYRRWTKSKNHFYKLHFVLQSKIW
jgi:hypothetical protein